MATQGLVTIRKNEKIRIKIVAGCNGARAIKLAQAILALNRGDKIPSAREVLRMSAQVGFGCRTCRVVVTETEELYQFVGHLSEAYRRTFGTDPCFNPRWESGVADYVEVIDF